MTEALFPSSPKIDIGNQSPADDWVYGLNSTLYSSESMQPQSILDLSFDPEDDTQVPQPSPSKLAHPFSARSSIIPPTLQQFYQANNDGLAPHFSALAGANRHSTGSASLSSAGARSPGLQMPTQHSPKPSAIDSFPPSPADMPLQIPKRLVLSSSLNTSPFMAGERVNSTSSASLPPQLLPNIAAASSFAQPTHQEQADPSDAALQVAKEDLPAAVRATLSAWFVQRGTSQQPGCFLYDTGAYYTHQNRAGQLAAYRHEDGHLLEVSLFKLTSFPREWGPRGRYILVAFGLLGGPQIIMRSPNPMVSSSQTPAVPFRIWLGIRAKNAEGWDDRTTIYKTYDPLPESRESVTKSNFRFEAVSRIEFSTLARPATNFTPESEHQAKLPQTPSISQPETGPPSSSRVYQIIGAPAVVDDDETQSDTGSISHEPFDPPSIQQTLPSEDARYSRELPSEVKTLILQWVLQKGVSNPLPCTVSLGRCSSIFESKSGRPRTFLHINGDVLDVKICRLDDVAQSYARKRVIVVEGPRLQPCIISYQRMGAYLGDNQVIHYAIWKGLKGDSVNGFEQNASVVKISDFVFRKYGSDLVKKLDKETGSAKSQDHPGHSVLEPPLLSLSSDLTLKAASSSQDSASRAMDDSQRFRGQPLPDELKPLIERWVQRYPNTVLPCTLSRGALDNVFHNVKGKPYRFYHVNGELLDVTICNLNNVLPNAQTRRVLVARGPTMKPCIIGFKHTLTGASRFAVWLGLNSRGSNGFERHGKILKATADGAARYLPKSGIVSGSIRPSQGSLQTFNNLKASATAPSLPEATGKPTGAVTAAAWHQEQKEIENDRTHQIMHSRTKEPASADSNADESTTSGDLGIPPVCQKIINDWLRAHPDQTSTTIPCASITNPQKLNFSMTSGKPLHWKHKSGEPLTARMYPLGPGIAKVIIVQGKTIGPMMVGHTVPGQPTMRGEAKAWLGLGGSDEHGFESTPSVFKYNSNGERIGFGQTTERSASYSTILPAKRPRTSSTVEVAASKPPLLPRKGSRILPSRLRPHLLPNLAVLFYSPSRAAPRVRLFNSCDTSQKLFAQAIAGEVFPDDAKATSGSRVLSARLGGGGKRTKLVLVEDDDDDFETLLDAIAASGWFSDDRDGIKGSGSVEVRAMK